MTTATAVPSSAAPAPRTLPASAQFQKDAAVLQTTFEQAVAICLHLWPALSLAVQNGWGGPDSDDKRAWLCGAVVDLFPPLASAAATATLPPHQRALRAEPDLADLEDVLLQVMQDEFDVDVDDDSAGDVAQRILALRADCAAGRLDFAQNLHSVWEARGERPVQAVCPPADDKSESDSEEDDDDDDSDEVDESLATKDRLSGLDVDMVDAPALVTARRERPSPQVDNQGFTTVPRRR